MEERIIIIAERDAGDREQLADHFSKAGYQVETAASVANLVCSTLENRQTVLLLGNGFDLKFTAPNLLRLLKMCNSRLQVIMVSDEVSLPLARQLRDEGLFYHALRPTTTLDTEELGTAVACAFDTVQARSPHHQPQAVPSTSMLAERGSTGKAANIGLKTLCRLSVLISLTFAICYLATSTLIATNATTMWIFLAFCALIISTQLLPIFRIKLPATMRATNRAKQQDASPHGK